MTVKELIDALSEFPEDIQVCVDDGESDLTPISHVIPDKLQAYDEETEKPLPLQDCVVLT